MVFWMPRAAQTLKDDLDGKMAAALRLGRSVCSSPPSWRWAGTVSRRHCSCGPCRAAGTADTCEIVDGELVAGTTNFEFSNRSDDVSELYVLRENGDVVSEVEDVTTGTTRTLTVDLAVGAYQVRCVPGQTGDGITTDFAVTGEGGAVPVEPDSGTTHAELGMTGTLEIPSS